MSTSAPRTTIDPDPAAIDLTFTEEALRITLIDGRELSAPIAWFPRLRDATHEQRGHWRLIGRGHGIHWPDLDEDVSVRSLLNHPT